MQSKSLQFRLSYEGPSVFDGSISVRDLAPSLLALSDLIDSVNSHLQGEKAKPVALKFKASSQGSIMVDLALQFDVLEFAKDLFMGDSLERLKTILELAGLLGGGKGVLWLMKKLRGRKITERVLLEDNRTVTLKVEDGELIEVEDKRTVQIYEDSVARSHALRFIQPLAKPGIEAINTQVGNQGLTISKEDAPEMLAAPTAEPSEQADSSVSERFVKLDAPAFKRDNKWRINDGTNSFSASMEDQGFAQMVQNNQVSFRAGDVFRVRLKTDQHVTAAGGIRTSHHVEKVLQHIVAEPGLQDSDGNDWPA